jgi:hypothetical protein
MWRWASLACLLTDGLDIFDPLACEDCLESRAVRESEAMENSGWEKGQSLSCGVRNDMVLERYGEMGITLP